MEGHTLRNLKMAVLFKSIAIFVLAISANTAFAEKVFEVNPTSPLLDSKGKMRIYECSGNVDDAVLKGMIINLTEISKTLDLTPPQKSLCEYDISTTEMMGQNVTLYGVRFYVDEASWAMCRKHDRCLNARMAAFQVVNKALAVQYFVTNDDNSESHYFCFFKNKKGKSVFQDGDCSNKNTR